MEALWLDLRYAVRMFFRNPGFVLVSVVTLAPGIGLNTAVFGVLNAVLFRSLPYPEPERLVHIDELGDRGGIGVSPPNFQDFRQVNRSLEQIAAFTGGSFILTGGEEPLRVEGLHVTHNLFSLLGVKPLIGRAFLAEDESPGRNQVAVISHRLWTRYFSADPAVAGRKITLDGKMYEVVGIMPAAFEFPVQQVPVDVWTPLTFTPERANLRGAHYLDVVGRLRSGKTAAEARVDLETIAQRIAREFPKFVTGRMKVIPLKEHWVGAHRQTLTLLAGAVALVLLIATANVASLLIGRAAQRQKEVAIRLAVGSSRSRPLRQLLTESVLLFLIGGLGGLFLARWGTDLLVALAPRDVPRLRAAAVDARVLVFTSGVALLAGILFGLAPALQASRVDLNSALKEGLSRISGTVRQPLRKFLVVSEVALAVVLLCGAGLLIRTVWKLNAVNPGFDPENLLAAEVVLPAMKYPDKDRQAAFFEELLARIARVSGVESVGGTTNLPLSGTNMVFLARVEGRPDFSSAASFRAVSPEYFRTMRIPLLGGRPIDDRDSKNTTPVVVINETMARQFFPGEEPLGKRIIHGFSNTVAEVVGVVGDVKYAGLDKESKPEMYAPYLQNSWPFMRIVVRAKSDPVRLAAAFRSQVLGIDKDQPVDKITTMESVLSASTANRRFYMQLLAFFAALALLLSAVGVYGVVSYYVTQRAHEIGVRVALGAQRRDVLRLILGQGMLLVLFGVAGGLGGSYVLTRAMASLIFGVGAADPATFAAVAGLLVAVAAMAAYVPAQRATRVDPVAALRFE